MILTELKCTNCNATLEDIGHGEYRCPYCGARYKVEGSLYEPNIIRVEHPAVRPLRCVYRLREEDVLLFGEDIMAKRIEHHMAQSLAENLKSFIKIDRQYDPYENATMIRGTIRVVEPTFSF